MLTLTCGNSLDLDRRMRCKAGGAHTSEAISLTYTVGGGLSDAYTFVVLSDVCFYNVI